MRKTTAIVLAGALLLGSGAVARGDQHQEKAATSGASVSCDQIEAAWDEGGGNVSEDMLAKKLNVPVSRIKECLHKEAMDLEKEDNPPAAK